MGKHDAKQPKLNFDHKRSTRQGELVQGPQAAEERDLAADDQGEDLRTLMLEMRSSLRNIDNKLDNLAKHTRPGELQFPALPYMLCLDGAHWTQVRRHMFLVTARTFENDRHFPWAVKAAGNGFQQVQWHGGPFVDAVAPIRDMPSISS
ncbi:hypothetical protein NDU88_001343 [Pleurodeles waltl]|uniref:Uncharacterized protein n=1 Tax=Pleurodeles waltl TaxID=8319 RepID=A0AAV7NAT1_PLEWA|nr:hypothetical protein NDU88_001343 [Pleurodeles waltl]